MNYSKIYQDFISSRKLSNPQGYTERHHIVPKSLGGSNHSHNIVKLLPEDHMFAHLLLAKIHGGKMYQALFLMSGSDNITSAKGVSRFCGKRGRFAYKICKLHYSESLGEHRTDIGNRLASNEKRIKGLKEYYDNTDTGAIVRDRYKDPEYYKKWKASQEGIWTQERRKVRGDITRRSWQNEDYKKKMKLRKKSPGAFTSESLKLLWKDEGFKNKMTLRKVTSGAITSEQMKQRWQNEEYRSVTINQIKERWEDADFKKNHASKLRENYRKKYSVNWYHPDHGVVFGWGVDMSKEYGGCESSWSAVRIGTRKHVAGWSIAE